MRIVVIGQQAFGSAVLDALVEKGEDVVGVFTAPDADGAREDPLTSLSRDLNLPLFQPKSFRRSSAHEQMIELKPDLTIMAYVTMIVPEKVLNTPTHGSIQYHPSLLPMHKGPSSINWPIIFGEKKTGLSIFWPDEGLDTGPILLQKEVEIGADDTLGSIYFDHLFPMGIEAILESVDLVRKGEAPKLAQDQNAGSYESWCREADAEIDWTKSDLEVYNLIRGCNPQPSAWTTYKGSMLQLFDSRRGKSCDARPGEVLSVEGNCFEIATHGGSIEVSRVRLEGRSKVQSEEFVASTGLKAGEVLGG
ncbi:MAG: methionyl-tRNA formyltransferase [Gammaproteobacteria bacterium]|nr:methionyl-tRNA formyltransferase [Gammaproteobacteria bacterium]